MGTPASAWRPVGVEHDPASVELDAVGGAQVWDGVDPRAVVEADAEPGDRPAAVGVTSVGGQQPQMAGRGVGVAGADPLLLGGDERGGGLDDR
jgi:hypothetical protein